MHSYSLSVTKTPFTDMQSLTLVFSDLERNVLKCSEHLQRHHRYLGDDELKEYFANAPLAFCPKERAEGRAPINTVSGNDCQLCFREVKTNSGIQRCQVCYRAAHQECHDVYRKRKGKCEGTTGCPLCCPHCPWNPSNPVVKAEPLALTTKEEPGLSGVKSETVDGVSWATMTKKNQMLERKVRKLQGQVRGQLRDQRRRKSVSRTMTDRQYKRLVAKMGGIVGNHRNDKKTTCQTDAFEKEETQVKEERSPDFFREPMMPMTQTVKAETVEEEIMKEEKYVKKEEDSETAVEIIKLSKDVGSSHSRW